MAFASAAFGVLFIVFGGISFGYSLRSVLMLGAAGVLLGLIAAPDIDPPAFRYPIVWQMFFSILGSLLVAAQVGAKPLGYAIAVVVGALVGYFARYWTKHINVV